MLSSFRGKLSGTVSSRPFACISGRNSRVAAVLGGQWGDEGKGKLSDVLAKNYDIVGRFNGGNNAGHTVVVDGKKFAFHLLPCGLVYPHTMNILGNGTVIHIQSLFDELEPLSKEGIDTNGRLLISDRAHMLFDFHKIIDGIHEANRGNSEIGTTKKGIGPAYASKMSRSSLRFGELRNFNNFEKKYRNIVQDYQKKYNFNYDVESELNIYRNYASLLNSMVIDGVQYVNQAYNDGKNIITEGANAIMLDIDYGTYPYVTSSSTGVGGICTGLGLSPNKIDCAMGVVKAYTTRVGSGPFPTELLNETGEHLQKVGAEFGVTTGRKRRCGWLDLVVVQYGHLLNNYKSLNLTKLDVLDDLDEIKLGIAYKINGVVLPYGSMPSTLDDLQGVEVVYESMPGWKTSIAHCRTFDELPVEARNYINRIEELTKVSVSWIGVGVGRNDMAVKGFTL